MGRSGVQVASNEIYIEGTSEVVKENTDYYGVGYLVGKPIKGSSKGTIFKTNEVEINMGAFGGDFIGNTVYASIEDDAIAKEFNQLDRNTLYVFKFEYVHKIESRTGRYSLSYSIMGVFGSKYKI